MYYIYAKPYRCYGRRGAELYFFILRVLMEKAVLLDGHGWWQGHGIGALFTLFLSAALHARRGRFGKGAAAQALISHPLQRYQKRRGGGGVVLLIKCKSMLFISSRGKSFTLKKKKVKRKRMMIFVL